MFVINTAGMMPALLLLVIWELKTATECANARKVTPVTRTLFVFQMSNVKFLKIRDVLQMKNGTMKVTNVGNKTVVNLTQTTMIPTATNVATLTKDTRLASVEVASSVTAKDSVFFTKNATSVSTVDVVSPTKNGPTVEAGVPKNVTLVTQLLMMVPCVLRCAMLSVSAQKDSSETCPITAASQLMNATTMSAVIMNNGMNKEMTAGINHAAKTDHSVKLVIYDATVPTMITTKSVSASLATSEIQLERVLLMANVQLL